MNDSYIWWQLDELETDYEYVGRFKVEPTNVDEDAFSTVLTYLRTELSSS
jgi:hypothetical protein